jgi:hypothetical protein
MWVPYLDLLVVLVLLHVEGAEVEEAVLARLVQPTQRVQDGQVEVAHRGRGVVLCVYM